MEFEPVIGLEVHAQLRTETKIFCSCSAKFGAAPNSHTCPVCLGMPGVLPVLNRKVVEYALKMSLATHCRINGECSFARKNYFYPDLPKGYQISQYSYPLAEHGWVDIELALGRKRIGITRIHMEEDAGKLMHDEYSPVSLVDLNRTGVPLMEIVSEPDLRSPEEAAAYLKRLHEILVYLEVCDGNMEEGSFRCDANVSLRPVGQAAFGTRAELKNMNSFRNVQRALEYEIKRQGYLLENGSQVVQETRLWDDSQGVTHSMRSKEDAHDYRYFPDPDLVPLVVDEGWIAAIERDLPELPLEKRDRFIRDYQISPYDAGVLTSSRSLADYYEETVKLSLYELVKVAAETVLYDARIMQNKDVLTADQFGQVKKVYDQLKVAQDVAINARKAKVAANWVMGDVLRLLNEDRLDIKNSPISPASLVEMITLLEAGTISGKMAKEIVEEMYRSGKPPQEIIQEQGMVQITDEGMLVGIIADVMAANPDQLAQYRSGKDKLFGFFVGQAMKATQGKANPQIINDLLKKMLSLL